MQIHPNLENYLRAIWEILQKGHVVRVKDLAKALGLKNGTIVSGLRTLGQKGLVIHEHYGHVELTAQGTLAALEVMHRHEVLHEFLAGLLHLAPALAEEDACSLEHYISSEGLHRLIHFIEYLRANVDLDKVQAFLRDKVSPAPVPLSSLGAGEFAAVAQVGGDKGLQRRLLDLGVVTGAEIFVEAAAPMGDPMEIVRSGVHLTLRKKEAQAVQVTRREVHALPDAAPGLVHVVYLKGDRAFLKDVEKLRLMPGQVFEVLASERGSAVHVRLGGASTMLSHDLARRIFVQPYHDKA